MCTLFDSTNINTIIEFETCYKQFGTNAIIVLMFVESQRVHI